ncbi:MAG: M15 family metallopeptidase [Acidimicrobiia bacterium]
MAHETIPAEFLDPEGDAESQDPELVMEATTSTLRKLWDDWMCRRGGGSHSDVEFCGKRIGGVPVPAIDAYRALEQSLRSAGYAPSSCWAYNCRLIAGTNQRSLHSAGIAVDIDPGDNPYTEGDPFSGKLKPAHVEAALAIRNPKGGRVWSWGGNWGTPDRMHFQLDQGPTGVVVDWSTVPGGEPDGPIDIEPADVEEDEMVLSKGSEGPGVKQFQECLLVWNAEALPEHGADGDFGSETADWVGRFQKAFGLAITGKVDGVTAALLMMHSS